MPTAARLSLLAALLACHAPSLSAQVVSWDGDAGDQRWRTATNWDGDQLPTSSDQVAIGSMFGVVEIRNGPADAATLSAPGGLSIINGTLTLAGGGSITDLVTSFNNIDRLINLGGALQIAGNSTVTGTSGCHLQGPGSYENLGSLWIDCLLRDTSLVNPGHLTVASLNLLSSSSLDSTGEVDLLDGAVLSNALSFTNTGTVTKVGAGAASIDAHYQQLTPGALHVPEGTLSLGGTYQLFGGAVEVGDGAMLRFVHGSSGTKLVTPDSLGGAGDAVFLSNEIRIDRPLTVSFSPPPLSGAHGLDLQSNWTLDSVLTNAGRITWTCCTVTGSGQLANEGSIVRAGTSGATTGVELVNRPQGVFSQFASFRIGSAGFRNEGLYELFASDLLSAGTPGFLDNTGTVRKPVSADTGDSGVSARFDQRAGGQLLIDQGRVTLTGGGHWGDGGGQVQVGADADLFILGGLSTPLQVATSGSADHLIEVDGNGWLQIGDLSNSPVVDVQSGHLILDVHAQGTALHRNGQLGGAGEIVKRGDGSFLWQATIGDSPASQFPARPAPSRSAPAPSYEGTFTNAATVEQTANLPLLGGAVNNLDEWQLAPSIVLAERHRYRYLHQQRSDLARRDAGHVGRHLGALRQPGYRRGAERRLAAARRRQPRRRDRPTHRWRLAGDRAPGVPRLPFTGGTAGQRRGPGRAAEPSELRHPVQPPVVDPDNPQPLTSPAASPSLPGRSPSPPSARWW